MSKINPKIDLVFKKIFGAEENKDLLKSLINSVLPENQQITTITIKNPYNDIDFVGDRLSVVDIKATDENEHWYNIEIQIREQSYFGKRSLFYWSELYSGQLFEKDSFDKLNKTISINLLDFIYFPDKKYVRRYCLKDYETNEMYPEMDYMDLYYVELRKFDNELEHIKNALDRWITFLNNAEELEKDKLPKELAEPEIKKAIETLERLSLNKKEREYYEGRKKFLRDEYAADKTEEEKRIKAEQEAELKGKKEGKKEGIREGKREGKREAAEKGILAGLTNDVIKSMTDLSDEEIDKLRNKLEN